MNRITPCLCALMLLLTAGLTGCGRDMEDSLKVQNDLTQALQVAALGKTARAKYWADQAISVDPHALGTYLPVSDTADDAGTLTIMTVFYSVGDQRALRDYMRQAAARFPNDYRPLQYITQADQTLGDTTDLKTTATALAALLERRINAPGHTRDETLMLALAQAYCDAGNLAKGAADYQAVIQAFPKDYQPDNSLAYEYAVADSKPDLAKALALARQGLALAPQTPSGDQTQEDVDFTDAECQDTLGWVQYRLGDDTDARANLQAVLSSEPRIPESYYHLGMVYAALKQPDAARAEFQHAVQVEPDYADPRAALASLPAGSGG